jgi:hypothetical protein
MSTINNKKLAIMRYFLTSIAAHPVRPSPGYNSGMENLESKPRPPCPLCGGTTFTEGALSNGMRIASGPFFQADKTGQVIPRPTIVKALACDACGNILLFRTTRS